MSKTILVYVFALSLSACAIDGPWNIDLRPYIWEEMNEESRYRMCWKNFTNSDCVKGGYSHE